MFLLYKYDMQNRSPELEHNLQGKYGSFRDNSASDKADLAQLRGIFIICFYF